jgi:hypothetical protein
MKKILNIIGVCGSLLLSNTIHAQVKYQLSLLPDQKTYMVSLVSSKTWTYPQNLTSTAQVTIKVPSDKLFTAAVTSLNPDVKWLDNSYIEAPDSDPAHNYISFGLTSLGTSKLHYKENEEIPLFTFRNIEEVPCVGKIAIINNELDAFKGKDAEIYNISNQISVLAAQGDVYVGNLKADVDCAKVLSDEELFQDVNVRAFPIPTDNQLTIEWQSKDESKLPMTIQIENMEGRVVTTKKIVSTEGKNQETFDFASQVPGCYYFSFIEENKVSKKYKFLIIR